MVLFAGVVVNILITPGRPIAVAVGPRPRIEGARVLRRHYSYILEHSGTQYKA